MKCSELFGMILFAVQLERLFGCKAFNKSQSIRVIGTSEKVIGYTPSSARVSFWTSGAASRILSLVPGCSLIVIKNLYMVLLSMISPYRSVPCVGPKWTPA
jgi:hypothetical protein